MGRGRAVVHEHAHGGAGDVRRRRQADAADRSSTRCASSRPIRSAASAVRPSSCSSTRRRRRPPRSRARRPTRASCRPPPEDTICLIPVEHQGPHDQAVAISIGILGLVVSSGQARRAFTLCTRWIGRPNPTSTERGATMRSSPEEPTGPQPRRPLRLSIIVAVLVTAGLVAGIVVAGGHGDVRRRTQAEATGGGDLLTAAGTNRLDDIPTPTPPRADNRGTSLPGTRLDGSPVPGTAPIDATAVPPVPQCVELRSIPNAASSAGNRHRVTNAAHPHRLGRGRSAQPRSPGNRFTVTIQWSDADAATFELRRITTSAIPTCVMGDPLPLACGPPYPRPAGRLDAACTPSAATGTPRANPCTSPVAGTFTWEIGVATASSAIQDRARESGACAGLVDPYSSWTTVSDSITIGAGLVVARMRPDAHCVAMTSSPKRLRLSIFSCRVSGSVSRPYGLKRPNPPAVCVTPRSSSRLMPSSVNDSGAVA